MQHEMIGKLKKIIVEQDGRGFGADWSIIVTMIMVIVPLRIRRSRAVIYNTRACKRCSNRATMAAASATG